MGERSSMGGGGGGGGVGFGSYFARKAEVAGGFAPHVIRNQVLRLFTGTKLTKVVLFAPVNAENLTFQTMIVMMTLLMLLKIKWKM